MTKFVNASDSQSVVVGAQQQHSMTISDTSAIFHLLSEGLYTNPAHSAYTEIVANAWDSHIDAGKTDTPIKITFKDGMVTIQDFGTGIPHDKFLELYGALGGTNKSNDVTKTGGMGIGKLAPLSVTDSFVVTNCHGGVKKTFSITKGSAETGGVHSVAELISVPTDETGMTVQYQESEVRLQYEAVKTRSHLLQIVGVHSNIHTINADVPEFTTKPIEYGGDFFFINNYHNPRNIYRRSIQIYILQGTCLFEVNDPFIEHRDHFYDFGSFNNCSLVLVLPQNMMINFTPNRESLIETENNHNVLNTLYGKFLNWCCSNTSRFMQNFIDTVIEDNKWIPDPFARVHHVDPFVDHDSPTCFSADTMLEKAYIRPIDLTKYLPQLFGKGIGYDLQKGRKKSKKIRKAVRFLEDIGFNGRTFRPATTYNKYTRSRYLWWRATEIITSKEINVYEPRHDVNFQKNGVNLFIRKGIDRKWVLETLKKLNPQAKIKSHVFEVEDKPVRTKTTKPTTPRKRFSTVYQLLNPEEDQSLGAGTQWFVKENCFKVIQALQDLPNAGKSIFKKNLIRDLELDDVIWDAETQKQITVVSDEEYPRYQHRTSVRQLRVSTTVFDTLFSQSHKYYNSICLNWCLDLNLELNHRQNNLYHFLSQEDTERFPKQNKQHWDIVRVLKKVVKYVKYSHHYYNKHRPWFGGVGIVRILDKHLKTLMVVNNTPLLKPLITAILAVERPTH